MKTKLKPEKYGYVLAGELRCIIVKNLSELKTPNQLSAELHKPDSAISRCIKDLVEHGIVKCVNPEAKKGKILTLTDDGKEILKRLIDGQ